MPTLNITESSVLPLLKDQRCHNRKATRRYEQCPESSSTILKVKVGGL